MTADDRPTTGSTRSVLGHIAAAVLGGSYSVPTSLGSVTLQPDQRDAAQRLLGILRSYGGALLADPVGSGKTYVALAVAAAVGEPVIIAPASLRSMWRGACQRCGVHPLTIISMESLGRRTRSIASPNAAALLIVDEAHHARNRATARWRALAELCGRSPCLLLSATPVHNAPRELRNILSLFLGSAADSIGASRVTVRRPRPHGDTRPDVENCGRLRIRADTDLLDEILALPAPLASDGSGLAEGAGALAALGLLRAWTSSDAALRAALRRRLTRTVAVELLLQQGRVPDRPTIAQWIAGDGLVQAELPGLFETPAGASTAAEGMLRALAPHAAALRALLGRLAAAHDSDTGRAAHLTRLLQAGDEARIVAFSHSAETVRALFGKLRTVPSVALLTGTGARVAGGSTSRRDVIDRFAPRAHGLRPADRAHDVRLLLTTDILSEGENLQDANVIVHLDLAWTAARMAQRLGRLVRRGSPHRQIRVYTMGAPVPPRRLLEVERRLATKAAYARQALGLGQAGGAADDHRVSDSERVRLLLRGLLNTGDPPAVSIARAGKPRSLLVAQLGCDGPAEWLAIVRSHGSYLLVASRERLRPTSDHRTVAAVLERIRRSGAGRDVPCQSEPAPTLVSDALAGLDRWIGSRRAARVLGTSNDATTSAVARRLLGAGRCVVRRAAANHRAELVEMLQPLERLAGLVLPAAIELELQAIVGGRAAGRESECWLRERHSLLTELADRASRRVAPREPAGPDCVEALLFVGPCSTGCDRDRECDEAPAATTAASALCAPVAPTPGPGSGSARQRSLRDSAS